MTTSPLTKHVLNLVTPGSMQQREYAPLDAFLKLHTPVVTSDANGNGDDVFKASNVKTINRSYERHGYDAGDDKAVYDYHNEDILDALRKTHNAVRGMWQQAWNQQLNDPSGHDASDETP